VVTACGHPGLDVKDTKAAPISVPQNCEVIAEPVPHAPVVVTGPNATDARIAWKRERARLDTANDRLKATRDCQEQQRQAFGVKP
jgi:hypothetical protein